MISQTLLSDFREIVLSDEAGLSDNSPQQRDHKTSLLVPPTETLILSVRKQRGCNLDPYHYSNPSVLSLGEAQEYTEEVIKQLPIHYKFTLKGLFPRLKIRGDQRRRAGIITTARKKGYIRCVGYTNKDQESRNGGYAALWEVVK